MNKGVTLIALVVTIIIMLILAGVAISATIGEKGLVRKAEDAVLMYETAEIQEKMELLKVQEEGLKNKFGTLEKLLGIDANNKYNKILYIENGSLVYDADKVTRNEAEALEEKGIKAKQNIIPIYTLAQFEKIASRDEVEIDGITYTFGNEPTSTYYLQNDIDFGGTEENPNKPIGEFYGVLDGQGYSLTNIYINGTSFETSGLILKNYGIIRNLQIIDSILVLQGINSRAVCWQEELGGT